MQDFKFFRKEEITTEEPVVEVTAPENNPISRDERALNIIHNVVRTQSSQMIDYLSHLGDEWTVEDMIGFYNDNFRPNEGL